VAQLVLDYLQHPDKLKMMSDRLNAVRGQTGAAQQIADIIKQEIIKI
jgi:lipid-A-disaccharide synthase